MSYPKLRFSEVFNFLPKSKIKAGDGLPKNLGKFPFYTSSQHLTKSLNSFEITGESLIFGTGGNASLHFTNDKFSVSTDFLVAQPNRQNVYTKFVYYFLFCNIHILEEGFKGIGLKHISKAYISEILIPLPPLSEQKRIADILDKADDLRQKRQQSIAKLDELLQATFMDMFGDPKNNPNNYNIRKLSDFYINKKDETKCGPFGSAFKKEEYKSDGVPVWSMDVITLQGDFIDNPSLWIDEDKFKELKSYSVKKGDVMISRAGTVGKMGVVKSKYEKSIISTNLIRVRFGEELLPEYFIALMTYCKNRLPRLKTGADGSFTHMNTGILDNLEFPYPPIEQQKEFVYFASILNKQKLTLEKNLEYQNTLFQSLQKAFNGTL